MKKILLAFGTRPEAIKMCPLVKEIRSRKKITSVVCVTGQHKQMLQQVLEVFSVTPDYDLEIMKENQNLFDITNAVMSRIKEILIKESPDMVLVHGDTTTAFSVALSCFYLNIPVGHVEAGLRTYNVRSPYPEEFNRQAIDLITSIYFAPTDATCENLLSEGKEKDKVYITGNTAIDALKTTVVDHFKHEMIDWASDSKLLLLTAHRRENMGVPLKQMFTAIRRIVDEFQDIKVLYPIHMNPKIRVIADQVLGGTDRIKIIEPLNVCEFHNLMARSYLILTDSGGIQEEAPSLGKPVLVMRETTERPEGVKAGTLRLVGIKEDTIYRSIKLLITDEKEYNKMAVAQNPYGDGKASEKIADILESLS